MIPNSDKLSPHLHYFFLQYLPGHRNVSPHTLASYKQTFIHLLRYSKLRWPDRADPLIDQFQVPVLLDILSYLEQEIGNAVSTRNVRLAALKSFFKMVALLDTRHQTQCRQIQMIPCKRTRRERIDFLDKDEVDAVFAAVDTRSRDGYRDLCILRTLYNTGARASELCAIRIADLDIVHKQVLLYGKGSKARTVPLRDSTAAFLSTYLRSERRAPRTPDSDFVFINQRRGRLTRSGLYYLCNHYLDEATRRVPTLKHKKIHPVHG